MSMSIETVKVLAVPTVAKLGPETPGSVVVGGSHAAIYTSYLTLRAGARAAIQHDAAFGRDRAGIAGLAWAEHFGFAMAAVDARTARIGDGADMLARGIISAVNRHAAACKVEPGMSCSEAASLLRSAAEPKTGPEPMLETRPELAMPGSGGAIVMVDSVALARESDAGEQARQCFVCLKPRNQTHTSGSCLAGWLPRRLAEKLSNGNIAPSTAL
jgi:hypothetical protein